MIKRNKAKKMKAKTKKEGKLFFFWGGGGGLSRRPNPLTATASATHGASIENGEKNGGRKDRG